MLFNDCVVTAEVFLWSIGHKLKVTQSLRSQKHRKIKLKENLKRTAKQIAISVSQVILLSLLCVTQKISAKLLGEYVLKRTVYRPIWLL